MPYQHNNDLPESVQSKLPKHAQDIYRAAFNNAWEQYANAKKRAANRSREATAHSVAWKAVEQKYQKDSSGSWMSKG